MRRRNLNKLLPQATVVGFARSAFPAGNGGRPIRLCGRSCRRSVRFERETLAAGIKPANHKRIYWVMKARPMACCSIAIGIQNETRPSTAGRLFCRLNAPGSVTRRHRSYRSFVLPRVNCFRGLPSTRPPSSRARHRRRCHPWWRESSWLPGRSNRARRQSAPSRHCRSRSRSHRSTGVDCAHRPRCGRHAVARHRQHYCRPRRRRLTSRDYLKVKAVEADTSFSDRNGSTRAAKRSLTLLLWSPPYCSYSCSMPLRVNASENNREPVMM